MRVTFPGALAGVAHRATAVLADRHPQLEVEMSGADATISVDGRQADVALRVADRPPDHLVGRRMAAMAGALYASHGSLAQHREPLESSAHVWVDWDRRLAWVGQRFPARRIAVRGLSTVDVHEAVRSGIGPLPCIRADADPELARLLDAPRSAWASVWLLTHRELRRAARVRAVLDALAAAAREEIPPIEGRAPPLGSGVGATKETSRPSDQR